MIPGGSSVVVMSVEDYRAYEALKLQQLRSRLAHSIAQAEAGHVHDGDKVFDELMKDL